MISASASALPGNLIQRVTVRRSGLMSVTLTAAASAGPAGAAAPIARDVAKATARADLPLVKTPKRLLALCFGLTFVVYSALVPRFILYSSPPSGDQAFYLMAVISLAQDRDLDLRNNYRNQDEDKFYSLAPHPPGFVGIGGSPPLSTHLAFSKARPADEWYNFHFPGLPLLLVPAWLIGSWFARPSAA